jgi:hypothetical protein
MKAAHWEHAMRIGFPGTGTVVHDLWPEFARTEHELPPEPDTMDKNTTYLAYRQGAGIVASEPARAASTGLRSGQVIPRTVRKISQ